MHAVEFQNVEKVYEGGVRALDGVTFSIPRGEVFALLGPNGAGKSTLIHILAGIARKTAGRVTVLGFDLDREGLEVKRRLGFVPQEIAFDPFFTPRELLALTSGYFGLKPDRAWIDALLATFALSDKADVKARKLSGGMRRRLLIAKALVHKPAILLLDEPTAGVDVELRQALWDTVRKLTEGGTTILLTTHYIEEAEEMAKTTCILSRGRLVAYDATEALVEKMGRDRQIELRLAAPLAAPPEALARYRPALERAGTRLRLSYAPGEAGRLLEVVAGLGLSIDDVRVYTDDLEDVFLRLTREAA